jgi:hypothetical protein
MTPWTAGTPVHSGPAMVGQSELIGAWLSAAPVLRGASQGAGEGKRDTGNPFWASPEDEQLRGD